MLEPVNTRHQPDRRKWYHGPGTDLYLWRNRDGSVRAFQLCWAEGCGEYCITGSADRSIQLHRVDDGESSPRHNRAPLLRPGTGARIPLQRLMAACADLDVRTRDFLQRRLQRLSPAHNRSPLAEP